MDSSIHDKKYEETINNLNEQINNLNEQINKLSEQINKLHNTMNLLGDDITFIIFYQLTGGNFIISFLLSLFSKLIKSD